MQQQPQRYASLESKHIRRKIRKNQAEHQHALKLNYVSFIYKRSLHQLLSMSLMKCVGEELRVERIREIWQLSSFRTLEIIASKIFIISHPIHYDYIIIASPPPSVILLCYSIKFWLNIRRVLETFFGYERSLWILRYFDTTKAKDEARENIGKVNQTLRKFSLNLSYNFPTKWKLLLISY